MLFLISPKHLKVSAILFDILNQQTCAFYLAYLILLFCFITLCTYQYLRWHVVYRQKFILTNFNFSKRCHRSHTCQHRSHTCQHRSHTCQHSTQGQQPPGVECAVVWCHVTEVTHVNTEVTHVNTDVTHVNTEVKHVNTEVTHVNTALRANNHRE